MLLFEFCNMKINYHINIYYIIWYEIKSTIIPAIQFPIKTPAKASTILILRIDAIADAVHVPVVGSGIPTNNIIPKKDAAFIFFMLFSIF